MLQTQIITDVSEALITMDVANSEYNGCCKLGLGCYRILTTRDVANLDYNGCCKLIMTTMNVANSL